MMNKKIIAGALTILLCCSLLLLLDDPVAADIDPEYPDVIVAEGEARNSLQTIQQLVNQHTLVDAVIYMQDFLNVINDPSVLAQQLISEEAAEALRMEANFFIRMMG